MKFTKRDVRSVALLSASPLVVSVDGDSYTTFQLDRAFTDYERVKNWSKK